MATLSTSSGRRTTAPSAIAASTCSPRRSSTCRAGSVTPGARLHSPSSPHDCAPSASTTHCSATRARTTDRTDDCSPTSLPHQASNTGRTICHPPARASSANGAFSNFFDGTSATLANSGRRRRAGAGPWPSATVAVVARTTGAGVDRWCQCRGKKSSRTSSACRTGW